MKAYHLIHGLIIGCLTFTNIQPINAFAQNEEVANSSSAIMAPGTQQESKQVLWSVVVLNTDTPYDFTKMMAYLTKTYNAGLIEHQNKSIVAFNKHLLMNTPDNTILVKPEVLSFFEKKSNIVYSKNILQEENIPSVINLRIPYSYHIDKDTSSSYINDATLELNGIADVGDLLVKTQITYNSGIEHAESITPSINDEHINLQDTISMPMDGTLIVSPDQNTLILIQAN